MPARLICLVKSKLFLTICTVIFLLVSSAGTIYAQDASASAATASAFPQYPPQSPQYTNLIVINLIHTFSCFAEGTSIIGQPCLSLQAENGSKNSSFVPSLNKIQADGGTIGGINNFLTNLYTTPPLRTAEYIASIKQDMGIIQPAYAQVSGSGNGVLQPVLIIWQVFRNIAYLGLIFILIVIGLMIMFRQKINPQTVISAQSALPGLILGLVMITFSYFLAALLVDTTFVATHLAGKIFEGQVIQQTIPAGEVDRDTNQAIGGADPIDNLLDNKSILSIFNYFVDDQGAGVGPVSFGPGKAIGETQGVVKALQKDHTIGGIIEGASAVGGCILGKQMNFAGGAVSDILNGIGDVVPGGGILKGVTKIAISLGKTGAKLGAGALDCGAGASIVALLVGGFPILSTLTSLILYLVLMLALLIAMFKLLFALISAYLSILISTITAPLQFLIGSVPGREKIYTDWFKSMIANLLAFPAVFAVMILAAFLLNWSGWPFYIINGPGALAFQGGTLPLLGGLSSGFLRLILVYGILLISPNIPNMIKEAFGVKDNLGAGQQVIGALGGGFGVIRSGFGGLTHRFAQERKQAQEYANLVRAYGPDWVAQRYGKAVQPSLLQPWVYFGQRDVFKPIAPWSWRKEKAATWLENQQRAEGSARAKVDLGQSGGATAHPASEVEETPTEMAEAVGARERE